MAERSFYTRTWPERLSDGAPFLGALVGIDATVWWYDGSPSVAWIAGILLASLLVGAGVGQAGRYRRQRDTYRRALVKQVRDCGHRHGDAERADYFEDHVPAEVLAEAFRTPAFSIDLGEADHG